MFSFRFRKVTTSIDSAGASVSPSERTSSSADWSEGSLGLDDRKAERSPTGSDQPLTSASSGLRRAAAAAIGRPGNPAPSRSSTGFADDTMTHTGFEPSALYTRSQTETLFPGDPGAQASTWDMACAQALPADSARDRWLEFCAGLGDVVWAERQGDAGRVLQVLADNQLVAVVDPARGVVSYRQSEKMDANVYMRGSWRSAAAREPVGFALMSLGDLMWLWGQRSEDALDAVPRVARHSTLELRRLPRVNAKHLLPRHYWLFGQFSVGPLTFSELVASEGAPLARLLAGDIASLHASRSLRAVTA